MTRSCLSLAAATALIAASGCTSSSSKTAPFAAPTTASAATVVLRAPQYPVVPALTVTSTAFPNGGTIPAQEAFNGCGGTNVSPDLSWSAGPTGTVTYVVTEFDPDAPTGSGFWHWTLYNIPATVTSIAGGTGTAPASGTSGLNDYGALGYGGPCPPVGDGIHHYHFTVSALNTTLAGMPTDTTGAYLVFNMQSHVVAQGTYLGLYSR